MTQPHPASPSGALAPILAHLRDAPPRTWSIIITVFGDAIVPRGGSVWLGTLLGFSRSLGIGDGVVRTAVSRLASDGWLERRRVGRNSFYRLTEKGREAFRDAAERIYTAHASAWAGHFDLVLLAEAADREAARGAFEAAGFGALSAGVWLAPGGTKRPDIAAVLAVRAVGDEATNRALAARAWPLAAIGAAYHRFVAAFDPLRGALESALDVSDLEAFTARTLLIHEYRRIVLRDPILPPQVLPPDWPGTAARTLCAGVYRRLLAPSERWLDQHALGEDGALLSGSPALLAARFPD